MSYQLEESPNIPGEMSLSRIIPRVIFPVAGMPFIDTMMLFLFSTAQTAWQCIHG